MVKPIPWRNLAARSFAATRIELPYLSSQRKVLNLAATCGFKSMNRIVRFVQAVVGRGRDTALPARSPARWNFFDVVTSLGPLTHIKSSNCLFSGNVCKVPLEAWKERRNFALWLTSRNFHAPPPKSQSSFDGGDGKRLPRLLIVQPRVHPRAILKAKLMEAMKLADSLEELRGDEGPVVKNKKRRHSPFVLVQSPRSRSSTRRLSAGGYFGAGTIDIVRAHAEAAASQGQLDAIFVNATLSGVQQRNLEAAWGRPVLDRVGLIIEIFGAHAQTREAKLQVELAALDYQKTRLVRVRGKGGARRGFGMRGAAEVVSARGRASGAIGGAGETELQLQRHRIGVRRTRLKTLLADVQRTRSLHRAARQRQTLAGRSGVGLPLVAVVGYTNAGKSSLVAALSQSDVYVDDRLFATLDSRVRSVVLPSGQKVLLSDTVGFISDLPVQLVEAFRATLEEVVEADLLLHVVDSSAPNSKEQREAVLQVLREIGVSQAKLDTCMVEAWNKVDLLEDVSEHVFHLNLPILEGSGSKPLCDDESQLVNGIEEGKLDMREHDMLSAGMSGELQETVVTGFGWTQGGIARLSISAATGVGLKALLNTLDRRISQVTQKQSEAPHELVI